MKSICHAADALYEQAESGWCANPPLILIDPEKYEFSPDVLSLAKQRKSLGTKRRRLLYSLDSILAWQNASDNLADVADLLRHLHIHRGRW